MAVLPDNHAYKNHYTVTTVTNSKCNSKEMLVMDGDALLEPDPAFSRITGWQFVLLLRAKQDNLKYVGEKLLK